MIQHIVEAFRNKKEKEWGQTQAPYGVCVQTSEELQKHLFLFGVESELIEGWWQYDDADSCSDRPYDEHTCLLVKSNEGELFVDITADQFQFYMDKEIPRIYISPAGHEAFTKEEPLHLVED